MEIAKIHVAIDAPSLYSLVDTANNVQPIKRVGSLLCMLHLQLRVI